jgi:hypothetical protein
MKKKIFLIFYSMCSGFFISVKAQIYTPLPDDSAHWIVQHYEYAICQGIVEVFNYRIEKDTNINNQLYQVISKTFSNTNCSYPCCNNNLSFGYLRNDSIHKKVFCQIPSRGILSDSLLYDFNLILGDTIPLGIINPNNEIFIVTNIDSFFFDSSYKKRYNLNFGSHILIEGIGSGSGLFEAMQSNLNDFYLLNCFVSGDSGMTDYPFPNFNCLLSISGFDENIIPSQVKINISPNILTEESLVSINSKLIGEYIMRISSLEGKIIFNRKLTQNSIKIYRKDFLPGIYFIEIFGAIEKEIYHIKFIVR